MVPPLLKLTFTQGPIEGESREYKAGSTIRIGRVLRGNEITIKDKGISTTHLKIVSDSDNWIIQDLGSSNGTTVNLEDLDPDTPLNLSHGDVIRLGGDTIIEVYFVPETSKLPPRPRRNNRRVAVADPDPVQEAPKKTRAATRSRTVEDVRDEVPVEKKVNSRAGKGKKNTESDEIPKRTRGRRVKTVDEIEEYEVVTLVTRSQKKETKEEEAPVAKTGNSRARRGKKNENSDLNSVKFETENTPKGVEIPPVKRATRSKQIGDACLALKNVKSEDITLEEIDEQRVSRPTRSKRKEIGGDSYAELDMVLKQARASRAKKRKTEQKPPEIVQMEARSDEDVVQDKGNEKDVEDQKGCSADRCEEDEISKNVEQLEIELEKGEDGESKENEDQKVCSDTEDEKLKRVEQVEIESKKNSLEEDVEKENKQDIGSLEEECHDCKSAEMEAKNDYDVEEDEKCFSNDKLDKKDEISQSVEQVEIELTNRSLGEHGETEKLQDAGLIDDECRDSERDCKSEEKQSESVEMEAGNDDDVEDRANDDQRLKNIEMGVGNVDVEQGMVNEKHNEGCSETSDDELDTEEEIDFKSKEASEKVEQERSDKNEDKLKVDIRKMTLREWFDYLEKVYFREQITKETEELIEPMRSKALRLEQYIAEQKQAMGNRL